MTPEEALAALPARWEAFRNSPEYREKMALAEEIAIAEAEAAR